jgi:hypothetical protein
VWSTGKEADDFGGSARAASRSFSTDDHLAITEHIRLISGY